jgi:hypothetical protein
LYIDIGCRGITDMMNRHNSNKPIKKKRESLDLNKISVEEVQEFEIENTEFNVLSHSPIFTTSNLK